MREDEHIGAPHIARTEATASFDQTLGKLTFLSI